VCLGAQLLGQALGGEVVARDVPEIGYLPLTRTAAGRDDEVVGGWPDGTHVLFVHEDEVATTPPDAVELMTGSEGIPAWRVGSAHAVQFHPEVTGDQLAAWIEVGKMDWFLTLAGIDGPAFADEARRRQRFTVPLGRALLGRWLDAVVRPAVER
jgi:GMP synthase (glutamine-hydrolysing)